MSYKKIRLYAPLFLFCLLVLIYLMDMRSLHGALRSIAVCIIYAVFPCENARFVAMLARVKAPGIAKTRRRLRLTALYGLLLALPISFVAHVLSYYLGVYSQLRALDFTFILSIQLMCTLLVVCAYEGVYYMENWKVLFTESEKLKQINLSSQYDFLKDQIKPHFLFNSLNTLSSIIVEDPLRAEQFVEEMSSVYRYLLKKNERDLTTLEEELVFLASYTSMLKTRFGDALVVEMEIAEHYRDFVLPPLVLQLLMENAVKHNVVSRDRPLVVRIMTDRAGNLHFSNNLQRKKRREISAGTGLSNLVARYELLNMAERLEIGDDGRDFRVVVPLSADNIYAGV